VKEQVSVAAKKKGLGRGLEALLGIDGATASNDAETQGELRQLAVGQIQPGRYQPRTAWIPSGCRSSPTRSARRA
jgi:ParB family transcriptional regulator, chromosome partitioning protein